MEQGRAHMILGLMHCSLLLVCFVSASYHPPTWLHSPLSVLLLSPIFLRDTFSPSCFAPWACDKCACSEVSEASFTLDCVITFNPIPALCCCVSEGCCSIFIKSVWGETRLLSPRGRRERQVRMVRRRQCVLTFPSLRWERETEREGDIC